MNDYPRLNVALPEKEIFLRLGGHLTVTRLSEAEKIRFKSLSFKAFERCCPRGRWEIFEVENVNEYGILLQDGFTVKSRDFAARNPGITHLWCGAVTVGKDVVDLRDNTAKVSESAVFDAVGAECADRAMDVLQELAGQYLRRQGLILSPRRYSPGYGDMALEIQQFFFERLHLNELDMSLSEAFYMIPEKSVTAFAGIKKELS